jgi:hypothetical protein
MRKLVSTLLLAGLVPALMFGAVPKMDKLVNKATTTTATKVPVLKASDLMNPALTSKNDNGLQSGSKYVTVKSSVWVGSSFFVSLDVTPLVYEPISNNLLFISASWDQSWNYTTTIKASKDNGATWTTGTTMFAAKDTLLLYPSFYALNPSKNANIAFTGLQYSIYGPAYIASGTSAQRKGSFFAVNNGSKYYYTYQEGPTSNNPGILYDWFFNSKTIGYSPDASNAFFYNIGTLNPTSTTTVQYGAYGFAATETVSEEATIVSQIPTQWALSKFKPSTDKASSSNNYMQFDVDPDGIIYVAVANLFISDPDHRLLGISTSEDNGLTWSANFDIMPLSVINTYVTEQTNMDANLLTNTISPYHPDGFKVYAGGNLSYVCNLVSYSADDATLGFSQVVEIYRKDGQWGIRKISDVAGLRILRFQLEETTEGSGVYQIVRDDNTRDQEFQLAKTADGQYLVAKWIDYRINPNAVDGEMGIDTIPVTSTAVKTRVYNSTTSAYELLDGTLTSVWPTDVFLSYRKINESTWSTPVNATNDDRFNMNTFIPDVVKDINNIPILSTITTRDFPSTGDALYTALPIGLQEMISDDYRDYVITVANATVQPEHTSGFGVDAVNESTIEANGFSIYPNPVADNSFINLKVGVGSQVSIDIYNMLGEKVLNVFNGISSSSLVPFNTNELANGAYVCKVTNGSSVSSVVFTVSK